MEREHAHVLHVVTLRGRQALPCLVVGRDVLER